MRNVFLPKFDGMTLESARERSGRRKVLEIFVSLILTVKASKDEILEMYLNDVPLGQRGSFAIMGVSEASRLFFGKDVSNVSLAEAATIAGVIQSPSALSPFNNPDRCRERRNVVLTAMADAGYIEPAAAERASAEPLSVVQRALEAEAPYFVDYVGQLLDEQYPGLTTTTDKAVDVYTTLDLHLQRLAQDAVRNGLTKVDQLLSRRKRKGKAEAALIAVDPRNGEILAFVGGRSYNQSQYNRVVLSRRQPGSVFKPFVYLAAFEQAAAEGRTDVTPASITLDEPETFEFDDQVWTPENYEKEYDGPITFRRALAHSRNLGTIHVAQAAGYDRVAALWKKLGVGNAPKPYPSIALGVFEATPFEIATAYTIFPNMGSLRPLKHILSITSGGANLTKKPSENVREIARRDTTYLVTNMMRSVLNEGTAARRARGRLHARRRRQDRHDQRPARRLVRRLHARAADGRVGGLRRQPAGRPERRPGRAAHLDRVHDARARRTIERRVRGARRHLVRGHRQGHRASSRCPVVRTSFTRRFSPAPSPRSRAICIGDTGPGGSGKLGWVGQSGRSGAVGQA